jgi:spore coat protein CotH
MHLHDTNEGPKMEQVILNVDNFWSPEEEGWLFFNEGINWLWNWAVDFRWNEIWVFDLDHDQIARKIKLIHGSQWNLKNQAGWTNDHLNGFHWPNMHRDVGNWQENFEVEGLEQRTRLSTPSMEDQREIRLLGRGGMKHHVS